MSTWTRPLAPEMRVAQIAYRPRRQLASWGEQRPTTPSTKTPRARTCCPPRGDRSMVYSMTSAYRITLLPTSLFLHQFLQDSTPARLQCRPSILTSSRRTLSLHISLSHPLRIRQRRSRCMSVDRLASGNVNKSCPTTPDSTRTTTRIDHQTMTSPWAIRKNLRVNQCTGKQSRAALAQSVLALLLYLSYLVCSAHYSGIFCCDHGGEASSARLYHGLHVLIQTKDLLGTVSCASESPRWLVRASL